jgi:hypothetical protein
LEFLGKVIDQLNPLHVILRACVNFCNFFGKVIDQLTPFTRDGSAKTFSHRIRIRTFCKSSSHRIALFLHHICICICIALFALFSHFRTFSTFLVDISPKSCEKCEKNAQDMQKKAQNAKNVK